MHQIPSARVPDAIPTVTDELSNIELKLDSARGDEPLVDSVYRTLRDAICDGRLPANGRLAQVPLAKRLGVSRTPVRDALQRLAQEGLVRTVSFRGFMVSEFSVREVVDVYDVRLALEPLAIAQAIPHYTRLAVARLRDICHKIESLEGDDVAFTYSLNADFHRSLIDPCQNRVLIRLLDQVWQLPVSLRMFYTQAALGLERSADEHRAIVAAVEVADSERSVKLVEEHIRRTRQETVAALDHPDFAGAHLTSHSTR